MTPLTIVNDTIVPSPDPYTSGLSPFQANARTASFIVNFSVPLVGALFALFINDGWYSRKNLWSYQTLYALSLTTIASVTAIVYALPGQTTRSTITLALIHITVETGINSLLLGRTASQGLIAAMIVGLVGFSFTFGCGDMKIVYFMVTLLGGTGDLLQPLLLFYGGQPLLALGSLAHVGSSVLIFVEFVHDFGVVLFNLFSFYTVWLQVGFIVMGLRVLKKPGTEYPTNPMKTTVPFKTFIRLAAIAFLPSVLIAIVITYFPTVFL